MNLIQSQVGSLYLAMHCTCKTYMNSLMLHVIPPTEIRKDSHKLEIVTICYFRVAVNLIMKARLNCAKLFI